MSEEVELSRSDLILKAKELFSKGSRNYFLKCYDESADELSEACALYEEIYGELSNELGMPYFLYAKSLIALAYEENKVIDISEEEENEDEGLRASVVKTNEISSVDKNDSPNKNTEVLTKEPFCTSLEEKNVVEHSSTSKAESNQPNTSESKAESEQNIEDETSSNLQIAWETLELAAKIFTRQGLAGLPHLAEVHTELANIEFENNIPHSAREDYEKALSIYDNLNNKPRRAMAEIHYKIGLTYLMEQINQEGSQSLKRAYDLIEEEINEMRTEENQIDKYNELIKDMLETKQDIWIKICEIEEITEQNIADKRAVLENYLASSKLSDTTDSSSSVIGKSVICSPQATDISHLIKRKKADESSSSNTQETTLQAKKRAL